MKRCPLRPALPLLVCLLALPACEKPPPEEARLSAEARAALERGDLAQARSLAEAAVDALARPTDQVSEPRGEALYVLGMIADREGDVNRAGTLLTQSVRFAPKLLPAWVKLASIQRGLGADDEAVLSYEQAVWMDPHNADYRAALCWAHVDLKHDEPMIASCAAAAAEGPQNAAALGGYAAALIRAGREGEAAAPLAALNALAPADRDPVLADVERARAGERTGR